LVAIYGSSEFFPLKSTKLEPRCISHRNCPHEIQRLKNHRSAACFGVEDGDPAAVGLRQLPHEPPQAIAFESSGVQKWPEDLSEKTS